MSFWLFSQTLLSLFTHIQQVEDTLNNSNELFLTFRKEMEEMSKKTKRLEKENLTLTRKHDQTNRNILEMAEERTRDKDELDKLHKKETQMRSIIQSMREQGRGISQDIPRKSTTKAPRVITRTNTKMKKTTMRKEL